MYKSHWVKESNHNAKENYQNKEVEDSKKTGTTK